jgi:DNA polymerase III delta subunit
MAREPDPRAELLRLERLLGAGLPPGLVLRGPESYFRDRALGAVKAAARSAGLELCQHDAAGADFELPRLFDDLLSPALFAAQRCVVIENAEELLRKDSPLLRAVRSFLEARRGIPVLAARSLRADNPALTSIAKGGGEVLSFRKLWDAPPPWDTRADPRQTELVSWTVARARELGLSLGPERALLLTKRVGSELEALDAALSGLAAGGGDLSRIAELGGEPAAGSPFQVAEELLAGRTPAALSGIEGLFRGGMKKDRDGTRERGPEALIAILLGTLRGRLREGWLVAEALERGQPLEQALAAAGVKATPFARRRLEEQLASRPADRWRAMLEDTLALERRGRDGAALDASDLMALALRWGRKARTAARS